MPGTGAMQSKNPPPTTGRGEKSQTALEEKWRKIRHNPDIFGSPPGKGKKNRSTGDLAKNQSAHLCKTGVHNIPSISFLPSNPSFDSVRMSPIDSTGRDFSWGWKQRTGGCSMRPAHVNKICDKPLSSQAHCWFSTKQINR